MRWAYARTSTMRPLHGRRAYASTTTKRPRYERWAYAFTTTRLHLSTPAMDRTLIAHLLCRAPRRFRPRAIHHVHRK